MPKIMKIFYRNRNKSGKFTYKSHMEPNHSETYLRRLNNPKNDHKPESDHISHVQKRFKQRFNIDITVPEYYELLQASMKHHTYLYDLSSATTIWEINYKGKLIWILYATKCREELPARIKTVLIPFSGYPAPNAFSSVYDHRTFTQAIEDTMQEMIDLSAELDLNDKKTFFLNETHHPALKKGALKYKINENQKSNAMITIAVKYLAEKHNILL